MGATYVKWPQSAGTCFGQEVVAHKPARVLARTLHAAAPSARSPAPLASEQMVGRLCNLLLPNTQSAGTVVSPGEREIDRREQVVLRVVAVADLSDAHLLPALRDDAAGGLGDAVDPLVRVGRAMQVQPGEGLGDGLRAHGPGDARGQFLAVRPVLRAACALIASIVTVMLASSLPGAFSVGSYKNPEVTSIRSHAPDA